MTMKFAFVTSSQQKASPHSPPKASNRLKLNSSIDDNLKDERNIFINPESKPSRRSFLTAFAAVTTASSISNTPPVHHWNAHYNDNLIANAAETIGKDPTCNNPTCLGVWDGLLADCPHDNESKSLLGGRAGCVSSQDDTPGFFAEPWDYSDTTTATNAVSVNDVYIGQMDALILTLETISKERGDTVEVDLQSGRYLRVLFKDGSSSESSVGEFYYTPNDTTVQFRLSSIKDNNNKSTVGKGMGRRSLSNIDRAEKIRKALRYTKIPVLRNRKRTFFFVESDQFDSFGPGYSEALGPPEEMSPGELNESSRSGGGRTSRLSDDVDPRMRIDWVETFPLK